MDAVETPFVRQLHFSAAQAALGTDGDQDRRRVSRASESAQLSCLSFSHKALSVRSSTVAIFVNSPSGITRHLGGRIFPRHRIFALLVRWLFYVVELGTVKLEVNGRSKPRSVRRFSTQSQSFRPWVTPAPKSPPRRFSPVKERRIRLNRPHGAANTACSQPGHRTASRIATSGQHAAQCPFLTAIVRWSPGYSLCDEESSIVLRRWSSKSPPLAPACVDDAKARLKTAAPGARLSALFRKT